MPNFSKGSKLPNRTQRSKMGPPIDSMARKTTVSRQHQDVESRVFRTPRSPQYDDDPQHTGCTLAQFLRGDKESENELGVFRLFFVAVGSFCQFTFLCRRTLLYVNRLRVMLDTPVMGGRFAFRLIIPGLPALLGVKLKNDSDDISVKNPKIKLGIGRRKIGRLRRENISATRVTAFTSPIMRGNLEVWCQNHLGARRSIDRRKKQSDKTGDSL